MWIAILGAVTAVCGVVLAVVKYFPAKDPKIQEAEERKNDVAKIQRDSDNFKKSRDTTHLGDID